MKDEGRVFGLPAHLKSAEPAILTTPHSLEKSNEASDWPNSKPDLSLRLKRPRLESITARWLTPRDRLY